MALMVAAEVSENGAEYTGEDVVGVEPSVV